MPLSDISPVYDEDGRPIFNDYYLGKWSRIVRIRDLKICQVCDNECPTLYSHAHHIFPKGIYPELAYMLWNGITCCAKCHARVVHSSVGNESAFRMMFWSHMARKDVRNFNAEYQIRITGDLWVPGEMMEMLRLSPAWIS